ncbi:MAG: helix-turn-helix transcriptional regulator [Candidatus Scalindua sp.]|jgi:transcriptional regulator with XRE-family HTH domain|nr:helix-turn-helix transcriptional regulator [Candidatus Scalindua sp.]
MNNAIEINPLCLLGDKVRQLRNELSLSQEALANICGFDRTYISLIERGKRNISFVNLQTLSKGLGISISELTTGI